MESIIAAVISLIGTAISVYSASDAKKSYREIKNMRDEIVKIDLNYGNNVNIKTMSGNGSGAVIMTNNNIKR